MPFYDFQCETCHTVFTVRATIKEKEANLKPTCPQCQSKAVKQIITAGLLLHSSGGKEEGHTHLPRPGSGCCG